MSKSRSSLIKISSCHNLSHLKQGFLPLFILLTISNPLRKFCQLYFQTGNLITSHHFHCGPSCPSLSCYKSSVCDLPTSRQSNLRPAARAIISSLCSRLSSLRVKVNIFITMYKAEEKTVLHRLWIASLTTLSPFLMSQELWWLLCSFSNTPDMLLPLDFCIAHNCIAAYLTFFGSLLKWYLYMFSGQCLFKIITCLWSFLVLNSSVVSYSLWTHGL